MDEINSSNIEKTVKMRIEECGVCCEGDGPFNLHMVIPIRGNKHRPAYYWLACCECGRQGPIAHNKSDAIIAWNKQWYEEDELQVQQ